MPTYEYRCKDCGHTFDAYQAFTDDPLTECPECHGSLKKLFGNVGISFKGSGFYKTDSRNGSKAGASTSSAADGAKGDGSGGAAGSGDGGSGSGAASKGSSSDGASSSGDAGGSGGSGGGGSTSKASSGAPAT